MAAERTGNERHGTIFQLVNIKMRYLHALGIPKMYVKNNIPFGCMHHHSSHTQLVLFAITLSLTCILFFHTVATCISHCRIVWYLLWFHACEQINTKCIFVVFCRDVSTLTIIGLVPVPKWKYDIITVELHTSIFQKCHKFENISHCTFMISHKMIPPTHIRKSR